MNRILSMILLASAIQFEKGFIDLKGPFRVSIVLVVAPLELPKTSEIAD